MAQNEFNFIYNYLAQKAGQRNDVIVGIGDDCALLRMQAQHDLAFTTDAFVEGVHFMQPLASPYDIGYKSLAVSLSDLAAMGAEPAWVTATLTLPVFNKSWLEEFCDGFFSLIKRYHLQIVGGDTTKGPLVITTQAFGFVPQNKALKRNMAQVGDLIYVTGTLGDAGLAMKIAQNKINVPQAYHSFLFLRLNRPTIRVQEGLVLRDIANAAIDVSDGLAADLNHILTHSKVGATLYTEQLPLSDALKNNLMVDDAWLLALSAGDDYELCFTVPAHYQNKVEQSLQNLDCRVTCIGKIEEKPGLRIEKPDGELFPLEELGYQHF